MIAALNEKIKTLPPLQQQELLDFAEYLIRKSEQLDVVSTDTQFDAYPVRRLWD